MRIGKTIEEMKEMILSSLDKDNKSYILKIDSHAEARLLLESIKSFEKSFPWIWVLLDENKVISFGIPLSSLIIAMSIVEFPASPDWKAIPKIPININGKMIEKKREIFDRVFTLKCIKNNAYNLFLFIV